MSEARSYQPKEKDVIYDNKISDHGKLLHIEKKRIDRENEKKRFRRNVRRFLLILSMTAIFVALFYRFIYINSIVAETKYNIYDLNDTIADLEDQKDILNAKIDSAIVLKNVEAYASESLGMQYPKAEQTVYIDRASDYRLQLATVPSTTEVSAVITKEKSESK